MGGSGIELLTEIKNMLERFATVDDVHRATRRIIREIRADLKSEIDQAGPRSDVRREQVNVVRTLLREARIKGEELSLSRICQKMWTPIKGGYPTWKALYGYCHRHESQI